MNHYNITVEQLLSYLADRKQCTSSRESHKQCYVEFGQFLDENSFSLSEDYIDLWVSYIRDRYNRQKSYFWGQYVRQLIVFSQTGCIPDELFYQIQHSYDKVPDSLKHSLDLYLEHCKPQYTSRSFELARVYCSRIMCFLYKHGVNKIEEISFSSIDALMHSNFNCSKGTREVYLIHGRAMLDFFTSNAAISEELSVMLDDRIYFQIGSIESFPKEQQVKIELLSRKSCLFPASVFKESIPSFVQVLERLGYRSTQLKSSAHILRALYLFLYRHGFRYHPDIADIWFSEIRSELGNSWKNWRRILKLYKQYTEEGIILKGTRYTYRPDLLDTFPEWCRSAVQNFMDRLLKEFRRPSTARNYKFSCLRFCRFLLSNDINSFKEVTVSHIRLYSITDKHSTAYGRATSLLVVKRFLYYLEEQKQLQPGLHQALFAGSAPSSSITDILNQEQVKQIHEYRLSAETSMELRTAAIVTLGLELGLRASDVIKIRKEDIDWKNRKVSVIQYKTRNSLVLPLTTAAGNALYRYLLYGRPNSESPFIFIRHHAPYDRMSTKICNNSLYRILPERSEVKHKGFHVLRRTFATNLLRHNAGIQTVMDLLGHTDDSSVMIYLSFDEERMRLCPLSLGQYGLLMEGGFN